MSRAGPGRGAPSLPSGPSLCPAHQKQIIKNVRSFLLYRDPETGSNPSLGFLNNLGGLGIELE
jgi:hypothetical protein